MMSDVRSSIGNGFWTNLPALTNVERLEAACHQVILRDGDEVARGALRTLLHLDVGEGLDPASPAANLVKVAAAQIFDLAAILEEDGTDSLSLRVATAHLCQTLTGMRSHLSGGRRTMAFGPRREA